MDVRYTKGTQSDSNPSEFIMSDATVDRMGDIIEPDGWKLASFKKNPIALFGHDSKLPIGNWKNVRVEDGKLKGHLQFADEGTSPLIDTLRKLVDQKIIRAVSVGFKPIKGDPIDPDDIWGGWKFTEQELLECSLVSVPANPAALSLAKGLSDADRKILFAEPGRREIPNVIRSKPAKPGPAASSKGQTMSLAERIRAAQEEVIALKDQITPLAQKIEAEEDLTEEEQAEFDRIDKEIAGVQGRLTMLGKAEKALAGKATPITPSPNGVAAPTVGKPGFIQRAKERPSDLLIKMAVCNFQAHVNRQPLEAVRVARYPDREDLEAVIKAITNPATTTVAGWAAELVDTAIDDFMSTLTPVSVYAGLRARGSSFTFGRNGAIRIPRRTGSGTSAPGDLRGAFVGEGAPIPVRRANFASVSLTPHKMGVISTFTREMAQHSTPAIEGLIREGMIEDTAIAIDTALLDTQAGTAVRPAGLMNGVTPTAGTAGGGVDQVADDLAALMQPFVAANAATDLVVLANPSEVMRLGLMTNALGQFPFRDVTSGGNLLNIPLIVSTAVTAKTLIMIRVADFATGTGDTPEFDVSDVATLHEEDGTYAADQTVTQPAATVKPIVSGGTAATPVRSLWQTATIGIRMLLDMDWAMRRAGMVSAVNNVTW